MEFTHEQISEIISEITNEEQGFQGLVKQELKQICSPDQWDITPEKAFEKVKDCIQRWQKSCPPLKRYQNDRYRFYFTYFKYEREIRGDDLSLKKEFTHFLGHSHLRSVCQ